MSVGVLWTMIHCICIICSSWYQTLWPQYAPLVHYINYCIAVNFRGRKLSRIHRKWEFHGENFHGLLETKHKWVRHAQNFVEKAFADGSRTSKFAKVFSLESLPLCGNCMIAGLRSESVWRALQWEERGGTSTVPSSSFDLVMRASHSQDSFPIPRYSK